MVKKQRDLLTIFFTVYHFNLKEISNLIENIFKNKITKSNYFYLENQKIDDLFLEIIDKFYLETKMKNIKFYIVFKFFVP